MPNEILPGIWIGNGKDIYNNNFLINKNINCIISTVNKDKDIELIYLPIEDKYELFIEYIYDIVTFIHKKNIEYKNILIYCKTGKQISPAIICCYLIKYGKLSQEKAINTVKTKSNIAFVESCKLKDQLNKFMKNILIKVYGKCV